jgi:hypothetical protein
LGITPPVLSAQRNPSTAISKILTINSITCPMKQKYYRLMDSDGKIFYQWKFKKWNEAFNYKCSMGRADWKIIEFGA